MNSNNTAPSTRLSSERGRELLLYAAIAILMAAVFVSDLFVPLGISVWVIYLIPTALAYFAWRPQAPLVLAMLATGLVIAGFFLSAPGVDPAISRVSRTFGILTVWVVGITGYFFIRAKLAVRAEEWLQAGQVALSEAMSGELQLGELGDRALRFLANYLGAQAGAVFIRNGSAFHRYATYGVPAEAGIPERFEPGDGLLGQSVKDGHSFVLLDVPDGYLYFGSGLGQAKPRHMLISPARADTEINAVLELGFSDSAPHRLQLLERVSSAIGIAVRSAKYRSRLQELLEETQRQAEELQEQSEELRAANEELEAHSRSLRDSQARLELQQSELEQTNAQLEEQTLTLESQRDDLSRAQSALQIQARELEQASRYKSEFVANMSHELRTPLNSLLIMARLLGDNPAGNLTSEQVKYARTIEGSGNDLLALINDILDISRIEAGRIELQPGPVLVGRLIEKLRTSFQIVAQEKGLEFGVEIAADAPAEIETDPQRLEQVLKNFLSNALKFTERGSVTLGVAATADGRVAFTVRDSGIGIAPEQQQTIFEAFRQADGTINRKYGGTGLGLSISRELARLLGGDIEVDSVVGRGSTFTLVIPKIYDAAAMREGLEDGVGYIPLIAPSAPAAGGSSAREAGTVPEAAPARVEDDRETLPGDGRVILVVEDDAAFARILYDLAHELGFHCLIARTADNGVTMARQYLPHAVILDIGLPDHTGLSVLDRLKRDLRTRHIPVHVVSISDYTRIALAFGAVGYMLKPVKREELVHALQGLEARLSHRVRRVLIVEDDAGQLESLRTLLASCDIETVGSRSAAECLERLGSTTFDCMVLDLSLPDLSGFELLEQLSQNDAFAFPPVIVYTGRDLSREEELRLRRYSKSIIIKGAKSPERLLDEVTLFLHQVVAELPEQQQRMLVKSLNRDAALEGRGILLVEDDVRNVFALTGILEPHGVVIQIARNGREAIDMLERAWAGEAPAVDLVLMDVMMPEMDGLTATREIRARPRGRNLPIITLTAKAMVNDQEECLAAGANDYLAKPLEVDKLLSLVRVWMPR